jgi:hypothetical protein
MNVASEATNKTLVLVALDTPLNERHTVERERLLHCYRSRNFPRSTAGHIRLNFVERQRASPVLVRTLGGQIC